MTNESIYQIAYPNVNTYTGRCPLRHRIDSVAQRFQAERALVFRELSFHTTEQIMKKPFTPYPYNNAGNNFDYKMEAIIEKNAREFESTEGWIYLGADISNPGYARIGMTKGDLRSRSYSSANANYYLFCAFKCKPEVHESQIKAIEDEVLRQFQYRYVHPDGTTKRAIFHESGRYSDCFYDVSFEEFFIDLHQLLYTSYRRFFSTWIVEQYEGITIQYLFNPKVPNHKKYVKMLLQYD